MNKIAIISITFVACVIASGCGKSKEKLAAEATQKQVEIKAAAAAASAAEAAAAEADARQAEIVRRRADESLISKLQVSATQYLKDPSSAQFQDVRLNTSRTALCGKLNSKNSFGGYVGFREFIATDTELFLKPDGCGVLSPVQMLEKSPADGLSCMKYALAMSRDHLCQ